MEGNGRDLISGIIPEFPGEIEENNENHHYLSLPRFEPGISRIYIYIYFF
jgi:hypothetical protein